ncbi:MAG: hypothetical protein AB7G10_04410 [Reyranellaceae bacterium]
MYVQWCAKGIWGTRSGFADGLSDDEARSVVDDKNGIICNWWRNVHTITPAGRRDRLNAANLERHVHDYDRFRADTPFISLAAGAVERDSFMRTNHLYPAERTAVAFATQNGSRLGYVFRLWVIVGIKPAVEVEQVAEEIRNLNIYRLWSPFQLEGELTAKIAIPSVQIMSIDRWEGSGGHVQRTGGPDWPYMNRHFEEPTIVSNIRELF